MDLHRFLIGILYLLLINWVLICTIVNWNNTSSKPRQWFHFSLFSPFILWTLSGALIGIVFTPIVSADPAEAVIWTRTPLIIGIVFGALVGSVIDRYRPMNQLEKEVDESKIPEGERKV